MLSTAKPFLALCSLSQEWNLSFPLVFILLCCQAPVRPSPSTLSLLGSPDGQQLLRCFQCFLCWLLWTGRQVALSMLFLWFFLFFCQQFLLCSTSAKGAMVHSLCPEKGQLSAVQRQGSRSLFVNLSHSTNFDAPSIRTTKVTHFRCFFLQPWTFLDKGRVIFALRVHWEFYTHLYAHSVFPFCS